MKYCIFVFGTLFAALAAMAMPVKKRLHAREPAEAGNTLAC
jgi:hypothetical protein